MGVKTMGVLAAIGGELGDLRSGSVNRRRLLGAAISERAVDGGGRLLLCTSGVGKVKASAGVAALLGAAGEGGLAGILVVGLAGGLRRGMRTGDVVHCERAVQADFSLEGAGELADGDLLGAWRGAVDGELGWFMTADRPVLNPWRRMRVARAYPTAPWAIVADMETAAAAAIARSAGVPWASMRVVSDLAGFGAGRSFRNVFPELAGKAADTVPGWVSPFVCG